MLRSSGASTLTPDELAQVQATAESAGQSLAEWLRDTALRAARQRPADPIELLLAEVWALRYTLLNLFHSNAKAASEGTQLLPDSIVKIRDQADAAKLQKANFGVTGYAPLMQAAGGALPALTVQGGTNSLVSVDAMQEFRVQTSSFAPEFGRTPGGQVSIVTRSGTNNFHGTLFEYFRNDVLDASNWFNGYTNNPPHPKAKDRQNDFGGVIGGPNRQGQGIFLLFVRRSAFTPALNSSIGSAG